MARQKEFQFTIEALDRFTAPMRAFQARVNETLAPVRRLQMEMAQVGRVAGLQQLTGALGNVGGKLRGVMSAATAVGGRLAVLGGVAGYGFKSLFLDTASQFERFQSMLLTTEKSQEGVKKAMSWISDFAVKTPYELAGVTDAFTQLRAMGLDPTKGALKAIGDAASAFGRPLEEVQTAFSSALSGQIEPMRRFGIQMITKGNDIAFFDMAKKIKAVKAHKNDIEEMSKALTYMLSGKFGGSMERRMDTWDGMIANLKDQFTRFANMVMEAGVFEGLKGNLAQVLGTIDRWAKHGILQSYANEVAMYFRQAIKWSEQAWAGISATWAQLQPWIEYLGGPARAAAIGFGIVIGAPLIASVAGLTASLINLGVALAPVIASFTAMAIPAVTAFTAALLASPIGWFVAGATALAGIGYLIYEKWQPIARFFKELGETIATTLRWAGLMPGGEGMGTDFGAAEIVRTSARQQVAVAAQGLMVAHSQTQSSSNVTVTFDGLPNGARVSTGGDNPPDVDMGWIGAGD